MVSLVGPFLPYDINTHPFCRWKRDTEPLSPLCTTTHGLRAAPLLLAWVLQSIIHIAKSQAKSGS